MGVKKLGVEAAGRKPPCGSYGDVDGDGYVTKDDADLVIEFSAGKIDLTPGAKESADVNGDGEVTPADAMRIGQYVEGKIDNFPVCGVVWPWWTPYAVIGGIVVIGGVAAVVIHERPL